MAKTRDMQGKRWIMRGLAGFALGASVLLVFLIATGTVGGIDDGDEGSKPRKAAQSRKNDDGGCNPPADAALENGFYLLKPGEPGLSAVGARTCMSVQELSALNPDLDPQAIPVGACINLRRNGCADR